MRLLPDVKNILAANGVQVDDDQKLITVIDMVKDRCTLMPDFLQQAGYFFTTPTAVDTDSIKPKWDEKKNLFFNELLKNYDLTQFWDKETIEKEFKEIASVIGIKTGDLMLPLRIMLVGGKYGPGVFDIAHIIGKEETTLRIRNTLSLLNS
jgi:glutamyl-tRNA synthetase